MKIYAGGFARFFLGNWEGHASDVDSSADQTSEDEAADPADVRQYFEAFQTDFVKELSSAGQSVETWSESEQAPYKTADLDEAGFAALLIIAARASVADKRMNPISLKKEWFEDPAVELMQDEVESFKAAHHLVKADTWIPGDFITVVETEVPERDIILGSLGQLTVALKDMGRILNTPSEVTRKLDPEFVASARKAHDAFASIVSWAGEQSLPVLIDP